MKQAVFLNSGYVETTKRFYQKFSSRLRPEGTAVQDQMRKLKDLG